MVDVLSKEPHKEKTETMVLPILPLKGTIVFPYLVVPLMIQQPEHTKLVDDALMRGARIGLFLQKDPKIEVPSADDLYRVGASGSILKMLRFPDGTVRFLIQGLARVRIKRFTNSAPYLTAEVEELKEYSEDSVEM